MKPVKNYDTSLKLNLLLFSRRLRSNSLVMSNVMDAIRKEHKQIVI